MADDVGQLATAFHDGDIVDVYFEDNGTERIDFGGIETDEGRATMVNYFVRADCTCDWIELDDVVDIRLVQPWTERTPDELATNTIGAGARPASQSSFALHGKRFRTTQHFETPFAGEPDRTIGVAAGTVVTVALANPDATAFVCVTPDDEMRFVLDDSQMADLLEPV